jgi:prepilin signal peptidase PulO-like enzyme (type II secretory pathway)
LFFVAGAALGGQLNRGIYRLAWHARSIGPWSAPLPGAPPRRGVDRVPILGWLFLGRESALHGRWFWLRPLLIELALGVGLAWLYHYEIVRAALCPPGVAADSVTLHAQYLSHVALLALMVVATFIDFDEQMIPDAITVPGTLLGLALAALLPMSRPLVLLAEDPIWERCAAPLHLAVPSSWPAWLDGLSGLACGLLASVGWWLSVLPWTWTTRRGLHKAWQYAVASLARRLSPLALCLGAGGIVGVSAVWWWGGARWESLCSALVGMAFGGALIWGVRIVGSHALGQEAMGFGDVTLMAMIGTYTGWQGTLIIFFLAPFAAVVISVTQWLLTGRKDIAFGPYLCLAALFLVVRWPQIWTNNAEELFALGWYIPGIVLVCLGLMGVLLVMLRRTREWFAAGNASPACDDSRVTGADAVMEPTDSQPPSAGMLPAEPGLSDASEAVDVKPEE